MADFPAKDANNATVTITHPANGRAAAAASRPVVLATEDLAAVNAVTAAIAAAVYYPATQAVSAAALPLPAGAATEASLALLAPARLAFAITPHDTNPIATLPRAVIVGGAGNVTLRAVDSGADVTIAVVAAQVLDIRASHIRATGTTATGLVGLA